MASQSTPSDNHSRAVDNHSNKASTQNQRGGGGGGGGAGSDSDHGTERQQRRIQEKMEQANEAYKPPQSGRAHKVMQAGAREYPAPPFKPQHQAKPGKEELMDPRPMSDAPYYIGSKKLHNKVAIITGGDSGIGRAIATLFAREGADVAIAHLPDEGSDAERSKQAVEKEGRKAILLPGDIRDRQYCFDAVARVVKELGALDVLVNNAAFQVHANKFEDLAPEHFKMTFETNLCGTLNMTQAAVPHMKRGSAIIQCGSRVAIYGSDILIDYSMTKGALHTFTRSLSMNLMPRGIRVNAVAPGPVWSPLNASDKSADETSMFGSEYPMGRPAQPEELAPAFVFLASSHCSSFITGEVLPVIGGY